ncbi:MAG: Rrf2 family transcriptional regulator [Candidatus Omnitrophota bacterium]
MFKVHKKVKYALIALKYISSRKSGQLTTAKEICVKFSIPFDPTARVLQLMAQQGVLKVEQGAHGGYVLKGDLACLSVYELSQMVVGDLAVSDCASGKGVCDRLNSCVLKGAMAKLNARVVKAFSDVMISEMIG